MTGGRVLDASAVAPGLGTAGRIDGGDGREWTTYMLFCSVTSLTLRCTVMAGQRYSGCVAMGAMRVSLAPMATVFLTLISPCIVAVVARRELMEAAWRLAGQVVCGRAGRRVVDE